MPTVSAFEAKAHLGKWLTLASQGEEIVITRHNKPIARLVAENAASEDAVQRAVRGLRELQAAIRRRKGSALSQRDVRDAINQGRP